MTMTFYQLKSNQEIGFLIQETKDDITLWIDEYEGGYAYVTDWTFENRFQTKEEAYEYIIKIYGKVELIENN